MFNSNLFTPRNILVIALFAVVWQIILSRATAFLHTRDARATADAAQ